MRHLGSTPPFRDPDGHPVPGSLAEVRYFRLGGVDQWVMLRGRSVENPPLVLLHGGPGFSETPLFRHFNAPLEDHFTVVYWDQPGAGKSYDRRIPKGSLTIARFVADLDELVDAVRARLGFARVALFGHSWGSVLGVLYAARFPEKVSAYVGSGQIGDWPASEAASYAWTLDEAERRGNRKAVKALRALGPPPHTGKQLWTQRAWLSRFEGRARPRALWDLGRILLAGPESSLLDVPNLLGSLRSSLDVAWAEVSCLDLTTRVPALEVPVFFFLGRRDHWVPPETSVAYFDTLSAPLKRLVWFEASGHEPFVDEPDRFNAAMVEHVRPVAERRRPGQRRSLEL